MSQEKKTDEEKLKELKVKINKMQAEKRRLEKKKQLDEKRKRDHALIVVGATLLSHYSNRNDEIINADDETIKAFVNGLFKPKEAAETQHNTELEMAHKNRAF